MKDLLVLKSIVDGYNISLCGVFSRNSVTTYESCQVESIDNQMGVYLQESQLKEYCGKFFEKGDSCYLNLSVKGSLDQLFSIGYTYNNLPFQLVENNIITGPSITRKNYSINFIYHPVQNKPSTIYFNSKGTKLRCLSLLIDGNTFNGQSTEFPNMARFDEDNQVHQAYVSIINYSAEELSSKGANPEILISIVPEIVEIQEKEHPFDLINGFILQQFEQSQEILRTHLHNELLWELDEYFYYFYNNGSTGEITVYVNSPTAAFFEVSIAKGKGIRPGMESKPLKTEKGVNQVILVLRADEMDSDNKELKGYYTIQVKNKNRCHMSIYWNNKPDLDYIELSQNLPQTIHVLPSKPLYFTFYVTEKSQISRRQKNGDIMLHYKSDGALTIYLKQIPGKDLIIPNKENKDFEGNLGQKGGIGFLQINQKDDKYCVNCSYVGSVHAVEEGQLNLLVNVEHADIPINIVSGFTFPDTLLSHKGKTYHYVNVKEEVFYINVSMLSGFCNVFVDTKAEVSANNAKEYFFLTKNNETHSYLKIDPKKYEEKTNFYIRVENSKLDPVTFTLSIFENQVDSPIEVGISKHLEIGPSETLNLFFNQKTDDDYYEVRFIIKYVEVDEANKNEELLMEKLEEVFKVGFIGEFGFQEIEQKDFQIEENRVYIEFNTK